VAKVPAEAQARVGALYELGVESVDHGVDYYFFLGFIVVLSILGGFSRTLIEEEVAFVRKNLIFKYQDRLFGELPVNTFVILTAL